MKKLNLLYALIIFFTGAFSMGDYQSDVHPTAKDPAVTIGMTNQLTFTPDTVTIKKGDTVSWKNSSLLVHSVTADHDKKTKPESVQLPDGAEPFDSGLMDPEAEFSHTFTVPGTYTYFCTPHEAAMRGVIIVE